MLSDPWYEAGADVPAESLQFDFRGSLKMTDEGILIEGGEIKSPSDGMQARTLLRFRPAEGATSFRRSRVAA
jgi:hypothetical protein